MKSIFTHQNYKRVKKWSFPAILSIVFIGIIINSFFEIGGAVVQKENSSILAISATIFSAIIGIAFPISLTLISHLEQTYKVNWISKMFFKEHIFRILLFGVMANLFVVVISSTFLSKWSRVYFFMFLMFDILLLASFFIYLWKIKSYMTSLSKMLLTKGTADLGMIIMTNDAKIVASCTETISRLLKLQNYEIKNDLELESFKNATLLIEIINKNSKLAEAFWGKEITFGYELNSEQTQETLQKGLTKKYFDSIFSSLELSRNINNIDFAYHLTTLTLSQFLKFSKTTNRPHQIQYLLFKYNNTLNEVILSKELGQFNLYISGFIV